MTLSELYARALPQESKDIIRELYRSNEQLVTSFGRLREKLKEQENRVQLYKNWAEEAQAKAQDLEERLNAALSQSAPGAGQSDCFPTG